MRIQRGIDRQAKDEEMVNWMRLIVITVSKPM